MGPGWLWIAAAIVLTRPGYRGATFELCGPDTLTHAEMAAILHLSPRTIEFHRARLRQALGIGSEWALLRFAILTRMRARDEPAGAPARRAE